MLSQALDKRRFNHFATPQMRTRVMRQVKSSAQIASWRRQQTIVAAFVASGLPLGVFSEAMPAYLRLQHHSLQTIGFLGILQLPWSLKFIVGPMIDRIGKPAQWLSACMLSLSAIYCGLGQVSLSQSLHTVFGLLACLTCTSAVFNVACDALFVHEIESHSAAQKAQANALRLIAFKLAMALGGGGLLLCTSYWGWSRAFLTLSLLNIICWLYVGSPQPPARNHLSMRQWWQQLLVWLTQPQSGAMLFFAFSYKASHVAIVSMEKAFWVDAGLKAPSIGLLASSLGLTATIVGTLMGSWLLARSNLVTALYAGSLAQGIAALLYMIAAYDAQPSFTLVVVAASFSSFALGLATAALLNAITRACNRIHAATQFALLTALYPLARALGSVLSGLLAQKHGYTMLFFIAALLAILPWFVRPFLTQFSESARQQAL